MIHDRALLPTALTTWTLSSPVLFFVQQIVPNATTSTPSFEVALNAILSTTLPSGVPQSVNIVIHAHKWRLELALALREL